MGIFLSILLSLSLWGGYSYYLFRLAKKLDHPSPLMSFVPIFGGVWFALGEIKQSRLILGVMLSIPIVNIVGMTILVYRNYQCCNNICDRLKRTRLFTLCLFSFPFTQLWALWELGNEKEISIDHLSPENQEMIIIMYAELEKGSSREDIIQFMQEAGIDLPKITALFYEIDHPLNSGPERHSPSFLIIISLLGFIATAIMITHAVTFAKKTAEEIVSSRLPEEIAKEVFGDTLKKIEKNNDIDSILNSF